MSENPTPNRLVAAYERMLERLHERLGGGEALRKRIDEAAETAVALGELTRQEAGLLGTYIRRDIEDAGRYLAETGKDLPELRAWFRFDVEQIEDRLLEWFGRNADASRAELMEFEAELGRYHSGEVTGPGTLVCDECAARLPFYAPRAIPRCPRCNGERFSRLEGEA